MGFLIVFTILLLTANAFCFIKKTYLYLFIPCMLFLPQYYGIEISTNFPLITVKRIMFIVFYFYAVINRRRNISLKCIDIKLIPKSYYPLFGYFVFRIISNLHYLTTYGQAAKTIFGIVFEQFLLLLSMYLLAPTKEEMVVLLKVIVWSATVLFIIGIMESFTGIRPFDPLYTVYRDVLNEHYIRLGLLRATATMRLPGLYGNMCVLILPLIVYLYDFRYKKRYLICIGLSLFAIIHSGSRSDIIYLIPIAFIYLYYVYRDRQRRLLFVKNLFCIVGTVLVVICTLSKMNPFYKYYYVGTFKAVLNEFGCGFDLDKDAPDETVEYGRNDVKGSYSRSVQLSGIRYVISKNPLFGLGAGAQNRRDVKYYYKEEWHTGATYDIGIVEIFCDEGAFGVLAFILLFIYMIIAMRSVRWLKLLLYIYIFTTLSTVNMYEFLILYIIIVYYSDYFTSSCDGC